MTRAISQVDGLQSRRGIDVWGYHRVRIVDVDITSYTTGGESFAASDVSLLQIETISAVNIDTAQLDRGLVWDVTNAKLMVVVLSTGLQLAAAADGGKWRVVCVGV